MNRFFNLSFGLMEPPPQNLYEDAHLVEFNTFGIRNASTINNETIVNSNE